MTKRDYKVPAAEKALDILEFMAARNEDVTQTELSVGLGRSIHEIYRVIQLLEGRGYLDPHQIGPISSFPQAVRDGAHASAGEPARG